MYCIVLLFLQLLVMFSKKKNFVFEGGFFFSSFLFPGRFGKFWGLEDWGLGCPIFFIFEGEVWALVTCMVIPLCVYYFLQLQFGVLNVFNALFFRIWSITEYIQSCLTQEG